MIVYLYSAVPPEDYLHPIPRSFLGRIKVIATQWLNRLQWRFTHKLIGDVYYYKKYTHSNSGDLAIALAIRQQLTSLPSLKDATFRFIRWGTLNEALIEQINQSNGLFVIAGSGYIFMDHNKKNSLNPLFIKDQQLFQSINTKKVCYGSGLNCNLAHGEPDIQLVDQSARAFDTFSHELDAIAVRDVNAHKLVTEHGGKSTLVLDPAFFIKFDKPAQSTARQRLCVGLNFALHGPNSFRLFNQKAHQLIADLKMFQQETNCDFVYFIHSDAEHQLVELLKLSGIAIKQVIAGEVEDLVQGYQQIDFHICQMMHSAILSMSVATPCLNLGYDIKCSEMFKLLKLNNLCLPIHQLKPSALYHSMCYLKNEHQALSEHIREQLADFEVNKDQFLSKVEQLFSQ